jgi:hypothetical protein
MSESSVGDRLDDHGSIFSRDKEFSLSQCISEAHSDTQSIPGLLSPAQIS